MISATACGIAALVYLALAVLLYFFPCLVHKKHTFRQGTKKRGRVKIIAHRGGKDFNIIRQIGAREGLENTIKNGADAIEMDVYLTKDHVPVVFHDRTLQRMTNSPLRIADLNYEDLPPLLETTRMDFAGLMEYEANDGDTRKVPLLSEVFSVAHNTQIYLELKDPTNETIVIVGDMIRQYNRAHITTWNSSDYNQMKMMKACFPDISLWFTEVSMFIVFISTLFGLLPFVPLTEDCFCVPFITREFQLMIKEEFNKSTCQVILGYIAILALKFFNFLDRIMFYHLKRRGIEVVYWVMNSHNDFERALKAGVDGIITDCPKCLVNYFETHNY